MKRSFALILMSLVLETVSLVMHPLRAQMDTHEQRVELRQRLGRRLGDPSTLDSLLMLCKKSDEVKDSIISLSARASIMDYYYNLGEENKMMSIFHEMVEWGERTGKDELVFFSWSRVVSFLMNKYKLREAISQLDEMHDKAVKSNSYIGMLYYHTKLGSLMDSQQARQDAIKEYNEALKVVNEHKEQLGDYGIYLNSLLGDAYLNLHLYDKAEKVLLNASEEAGDAASLKLVPQIYLYTLYSNKQDTLRARQCRDWILSNYSRKDLLTSSRRIFESAEIRYFLATGQISEAENMMAHARLTQEDSLELASILYALKGDYRKAAELVKRHKVYSDTLNMRILYSRIKQYNEELNKKGLDTRNKQEEQLMRKLMLEQTERAQMLLEMEQENRAVYLQLLKDSIEWQEESNKAEELRHEVALRKQKMDDDDNESREYMLRILIFSMSMLAGIGIILLVAAYFVNRHIKKQRDLADQATREAERSNLMKTMFLQNMNHEIRSPLTTIVEFSDLLNSPLANEISEEEHLMLMQGIHTNTELLLTLVGDLIDLTSFQSGNYKLKYQTISLNNLLQTAVSGMEARCQPGVTMTAILPREDCVIETDEKRLLQIFNNLLSNACKYTEQGSITVTYHTEGQNVFFDVTDTGKGIPKDKSDAIFQRFEKIGSVKKGFGLGLSICLSILNLMGGKIWLDTNYTQGARFCFMLPIQRNMEEQR